MQYPHPHAPHSVPPQPPVSGPPPSPSPRRSLATRFFATVGILAASAIGLAVVATILWPDAVGASIAAALYTLGSKLLYGQLPGEGP